MTPLLTFYGDDFTGASAVMEVLSFAGLPSIMFLDKPDPEILQKQPELKVIGVASVARAQSPDWMHKNLPPVFEALKEFRAPVMHYKICSTFDSSPEVGSIGTAIEIGSEIFEGDWTPLVVGAPAIYRYQAFGQLFATVDNKVHRLDRHPVMSVHPVTPMDEADLGIHLSRQTDKTVGVVDLAAMKSGRSDETIERLLRQGTEVMALDVVDDETLAETGRLIWQNRENSIFTVGSQGVEYALVEHWRATGVIEKHFSPPTLSKVGQIFVVNGSCSPVTASQIETAEKNGFAVINFNAVQALDPWTVQGEVERCLKKSLELLAQGRDVLVTTARGPDDPTVRNMPEFIRSTGAHPGDINARIGQALGQLVLEIRIRTKLPRIVISGGDTSGHALETMRAGALSIVAPLSPGAPLCRVHAQNQTAINGLEVTLKGGQMGDTNFFVRAKGEPENLTETDTRKEPGLENHGELS
jgi:3-oxoisoapionate kinase